MSRPWKIDGGVWNQCMELFPKWLRERSGIVVYENHVLDSFYLGQTTFMPAKFIAEEDNQLHDAPEEHRPHGGLPSMRQQKVDVVRLEDFGGDVVQALACFVRDDPPAPEKKRRRG